MKFLPFELLDEGKSFGHALLKSWLGILCVVAFLWLFAIYPVVYRLSEESEVTFTVKEKERVEDSSGKSSRYLIFTEEGEVLENTDSISFWKFNSSDIYGELEVGQTYTARIAGWRVPFLSMYRNIIEIEDEPVSH